MHVTTPHERQRSRPDARCVLDRSRPCNACVAAGPAECPYPYLLGEGADEAV